MPRAKKTRLVREPEEHAHQETRQPKPKKVKTPKCGDAITVDGMVLQCDKPEGHKNKHRVKGTAESGQKYRMAWVR